MNSKLRYLALALLITTGLNSTPVKIQVQEDTGSAVYTGFSSLAGSLIDYSKTFFDSADEDASETIEVILPMCSSDCDCDLKDEDLDVTEDKGTDSNDGVVTSVKAIPTAIKALAHNGVAGVESFVVGHPKSVAGVAVVATVATVYSVVKWRALAYKAATLKEQLEEVNAIIA